jgi:hypothetical protein
MVMKMRYCAAAAFISLDGMIQSLILHRDISASPAMRSHTLRTKNKTKMLAPTKIIQSFTDTISFKRLRYTVKGKYHQETSEIEIEAIRLHRMGKGCDFLYDVTPLALQYLTGAGLMNSFKLELKKKLK